MKKFTLRPKQKVSVNMTRFIFLDFDGVLNSSAYFDSIVKDEIYGGGFDSMIDEKAVALVNQLVDKTQASVIVSSTWRLFQDLPALQRTLDAAGATFKLAGATRNLNGAMRGVEIQDYMDSNPCDSFVILDDVDNMGKLKPFLIQTSYDDGLKQEHIDKAVRLLVGV